MGHYKIPGLTWDPLVGQIAGRQSFDYPPSFLFRYLERLVRSLIFTFLHYRLPRFSTVPVAAVSVLSSTHDARQNDASTTWSSKIPQVANEDLTWQWAQIAGPPLQSSSQDKDCTFSFIQMQATLRGGMLTIIIIGLLSESFCKKWTLRHSTTFWPLGSNCKLPIFESFFASTLNLSTATSSRCLPSGVRTLRSIGCLTSSSTLRVVSVSSVAMR